MATVAAVATVVGAVAGVGSAISQRRQQKKVAREQQRQNQIQNRIARAGRAREVRQAFARQRVEQAQQLQAGFSFGVPGSSSVQQSFGAAGSDTASAIGFSGVQAGGAELIAQSQNRISQIQGQFNPFSAIQSGASVFGNAQTNEAVAGIFR